MPKFIDASGMEIVHNGTYELLCDIDNRMVAGSHVQVVELRECTHPFVFCYGLKAGSAYVKQTQLRQVA